MKKIILVLLVFSVSLMLSSCSKKDSAGTDSKQKTETKSDGKKDVTYSENSTYHIKYDGKGEKNSGTIELWIKGKNIKMDLNMTEGGKKNNANMYYVDKIAYIITEMEGKKVGMKMDISKDKDSEKGLDMGIVGIKEKLKDYEKIGTEEVLGYKCDIYKTKQDSKISVYKDIFALKEVDKNNDVLVATVFEPDVKLADDFFTPPKDIEFLDMNDMQNMMK
jgi:hypothetical protein